MLLRSPVRAFAVRPFLAPDLILEVGRPARAAFVFSGGLNMGVWKKIGHGAKIAGKIVLNQALGDTAFLKSGGTPVVEGWRTSALGASFILGGIGLLGWAPDQEQLGWALIASGIAALLGADAGVVGRMLSAARPQSQQNPPKQPGSSK